MYPFFLMDRKLIYRSREKASLCESTSREQQTKRLWSSLYSHCDSGLLPTNLARLMKLILKVFSQFHRNFHVEWQSSFSRVLLPSKRFTSLYVALHRNLIELDHHFAITLGSGSFWEARPNWPLLPETNLSRFERFPFIPLIPFRLRSAQ